MTMMAQQVQVNRVENGWVLTVYHAGNTLTLVAKDIGEVAGFIKGLEWATPRPLPDMPMEGATPAMAPSALGRGY